MYPDDCFLCARHPTRLEGEKKKTVMLETGPLQGQSGNKWEVLKQSKRDTFGAVKGPSCLLSKQWEPDPVSVKLPLTFYTGCCDTSWCPVGDTKEAFLGLIKLLILIVSKRNFKVMPRNLCQE